MIKSLTTKNFCVTLIINLINEATYSMKLNKLFKSVIWNKNERKIKKWMIENKRLVTLKTLREKTWTNFQIIAFAQSVISFVLARFKYCDFVFIRYNSNEIMNDLKLKLISFSFLQSLKLNEGALKMNWKFFYMHIKCDGSPPLYTIV